MNLSWCRLRGHLAQNTGYLAEQRQLRWGQLRELVLRRHRPCATTPSNRIVRGSNRGRGVRPDLSHRTELDSPCSDIQIGIQIGVGAGGREHLGSGLLGGSGVAVGKELVAGEDGEESEVGKDLHLNIFVL